MINNTMYIVRKDFVMSERVKGFPPIIFEDSLVNIPDIQNHII